MRAKVITQNEEVKLEKVTSEVTCSRLKAQNWTSINFA